MVQTRLCLMLVATMALLVGAPGLGRAGDDPRPPARSAVDRDTDIAAATRLREAGRWLEALAIYERLQAQRPADDEIYRMRVLTLADLGGAARAWRLYRARPDLFSPAERNRLEADRLARLVVWGRLYPESEAAWQDEMRFARQELERYLETLDPEQRATAARLWNDRFVALNGLELHGQAVEAYRELVDEGVDVPAYASVKLGDSLLAERHQREAISVLERALEERPEDVNSRVLLAYAYLEIEDHKNAIEQAKAAAEANAPWPRVPHAKDPYENWRRFDADHHLAMLYSYGERLEEAQNRLETRLAIAPRNAQLQARLGEIYHRRGWSERALERQRMAETLDPRNVRARLGQAESLLALRRVDEARPVYEELVARYPGNVHVQQLQDRWDRLLGWRWIATVAGGESDARDATVSASPLGTRDVEYSLYGETPLIADRWRVTAHANDKYADFDSVRVHHRRAGLGVLYEYDHLQAALDVSEPSDDFSDDVSVGLRGQWRFHDTLRGSVAVQRVDPGASLQARRFGITADSAEMGLEWSPSELEHLELGVKHWRYDDDNRREAVRVNGLRRLLTRPHFLLTGMGDAYASRSSRDDAPYFNPSRDWSWNLGLQGDHLVWRRYEQHFRHRLTVHAGQYRQEGFGTAWVPKIEYRHEWAFGLGRVLDYGIAWSRPVYDGQREERIGVDIGFHWGAW